MRLGINLRGDLAKLDDAEIAARYETLISEKEARVRNLPKHVASKPMYRLAMRVPWRGPLHARIFYKMQAVLIGVLAGLNGGALPSDVDYKFYLMECELRDVTDEIKRRVAQKKLSQSRS